QEGIAAMGLIPLVSLNRVIGTFTLYHDAPHAFPPEDLQLAGVIAAQVAFAVQHTRAEALMRRSEERLLFALDAASMGTWDWDLTTSSVAWSENLERIHGLPAGTFDGTFASYEKEIHPDDRGRVFASIQRAVTEGVPHEVEYRIVSPDGVVRWVEGKGRVEYDNGRPVRMSGVCMMVTERKEAELARLATAEETSRLKDEFLATLSHELRTPLNAILGWAQMAQAGALPPERAGQAMDVIARNARLQAQLIEDILDVSRIIAGKLEIVRRPVLMPQMIEAVLTSIAPAAEAKQIEVTTRVPADLPPIDGDPKRLHQVFANIVSNAVKFTPDRGRVEIDAAVEGDALVIRTKDGGVGIAPEFLPYVFDRFRQADSRSTRRHGGLGLGLAIAQHLVTLHGGRIRAESDGLGRGASLVVELPVGAHVTATPMPAARRPRSQPLNLAGTTAVVVDDAADSRELLCAVLQNAAATVVACESAASALTAIGAHDVGLVVADIAMPDVDGYELIRQIRTIRKDLPAIAVSAFAHPEDRARAIAAGYSAYCAKPLDTAAFLNVVRDALGERAI
ncbi:MAG: ATP-binding protein, partial [Vicinamibacterales bacterium]